MYLIRLSLGMTTFLLVFHKPQAYRIKPEAAHLK